MRFFLEGSRGHFRAKKGGKSGSQGAKNDQKNGKWSENGVGRVHFLVDPGPNLFLPDRGDQNTSREGRGRVK